MIGAVLFPIDSTRAEGLALYNSQDIKRLKRLQLWDNEKQIISRDHVARTLLLVSRPGIGLVERNLGILHTYEWTGLILLPDGAQFASAVDFKAKRLSR